MRRPSADHFGLPAKPPVWVSCRNLLPSALITYRFVDCKNSKPPWVEPLAPDILPECVSRAEVNAIHLPSGDQLGRKLDGWLVRLRYLCVARSSNQISAIPLPRVETKAR